MLIYILTVRDQADFNKTIHRSVWEDLSPAQTQAQRVVRAHDEIQPDEFKDCLDVSIDAYLLRTANDLDEVDA